MGVSRQGHESQEGFHARFRQTIADDPAEWCGCWGCRCEQYNLFDVRGDETKVSVAAANVTVWPAVLCLNRLLPILSSQLYTMVFCFKESSGVETGETASTSLTSATTSDFTRQKFILVNRRNQSK